MKKYIKPSIEVIKLQTEDAILTGSPSGDSINFDINAGEQTESAWSQDKGWSSDNWNSED
jgi:hypothetical protein